MKVNLYIPDDQAELYEEAKKALDKRGSVSAAFLEFLETKAYEIRLDTKCLDQRKRVKTMLAWLNFQKEPNKSLSTELSVLNSDYDVRLHNIKKRMEDQELFLAMYEVFINESEKRITIFESQIQKLKGGPV